MTVWWFCIAMFFAPILIIWAVRRCILLFRFLKFIQQHGWGTDR